MIRVEVRKFLSMVRRRGLLCIVMGLSAFGCSPEVELRKGPPERVLLIGMDGGEWHIVHPLMKMGRMPVIERIVKDGCHGLLHSPSQSSPIEWTSIVTGQNGEGHGISSMVKGMGKPEDGNEGETAKFEKPRSMNRWDRKVPALWSMLSNAGHSVAFYGWWATWPVERVNGVLMTDMFPYRSDTADTYFPASDMAVQSRIAEGAEQEARHWLQVHCPVITGTEDLESRDLRQLTDINSSFREQLIFDFQKVASAIDAIETRSPECLGVYLRSSDLASHFYFRDAFIDNGENNWTITASDRRHYGMIIPEVYTLYDHFCERLLANYREAPMLLIISDHGFGSATNQVLFMVKRFLYRSELRIESLPLLESCIIQDNNRGSFRIMLKQSYLSRLTGDPMLAFADLATSLQSAQTVSGVALFNLVEVNRTREGVPAVKCSVNPAVELTDKLILGGTTEYVFDIYQWSRWSGSHRQKGLALFSGPHIMRSRLIRSEMATWDICPTILNHFELPAAADMEGKPIESMYRENYLVNRPLPFGIASYGLVTEMKPSENAVKPKSDSGETLDKRVIDELKSIGYL